MKLDTIKTSFAGGEFAPSLYGRSDIAQYDNACSIVENMIVSPYGSVISTPGSEFINDAKYDTVAGGLDDNTILLLHFDTTPGFTVDSTGNNTASVLGLVAIDTGQAVFDQSARFTPSASVKSANYLQITPSNSNIYDLTYAGSFTFDFRIRFNSFPTGNGSNSIFYIFRQKGSVSSGVLNDVSYFYYQKLSATEHRFEWRTASAAGTSYTFTSSNINLNLNQWYHIAYIKSSSTINLYRDGVLDVTGEIGLNVSPGSLNSLFQIGEGNNDTEADEFDGWLDEVRWSNVVRWTSNFTVPDTEYSDTSSSEGIAERVYGRARLIPFVFNRDDSYIIEAGESYFRFYTDGAVVTT